MSFLCSIPGDTPYPALTTTDRPAPATGRSKWLMVTFLSVVWRHNCNTNWKLGKTSNSIMNISWCTCFLRQTEACYLSQNGLKCAILLPLHLKNRDCRHKATTALTHHCLHLHSKPFTCVQCKIQLNCYVLKSCVCHCCLFWGYLFI